MRNRQDIDLRSAMLKNDRATFLGGEDDDGFVALNGSD